jgi:hypothetical protein
MSLQIYDINICLPDYLPEYNSDEFNTSKIKMSNCEQASDVAFFVEFVDDKADDHHYVFASTGIPLSMSIFTLRLLITRSLAWWVLAYNKRCLPALVRQIVCATLVQLYTDTSSNASHT